MEHSVRHTVIFIVALCVFFSLVVCVVAVNLKDRQDENARLDKIKNVLSVAGLMEPGQKMSREEITQVFEERIEARVVNLESGQQVEGVDPLGYDPRKAARNPSTGRQAPENRAKVRRIANDEVIFLLKDGEAIEGIILPIHGYGLWSTLYGFLALDADALTIRGITYYSHGETAGLGGEVDNPRWKALWPGRKAFDDSGDVAIRVIKGHTGPPEEDPYEVDGLSGATITSNGVTNMLDFWLGKNGFANYLAAYRNERGI